MPIARHRLGKQVLAEAYRGTIRRLFLGNGAVKTPKNFLETVFSVWSAMKLYKAEFQVSCQKNGNENRRSTKE
jgi:hypothetical protein